LVINIVKDDDNLVHQMGAETWKMGLYSNSSDKGDTVTILCGIFLTDIYDNATEFKGADIVGNIVKDDDNLVRQMWADA